MLVPSEMRKLHGCKSNRIWRKKFFFLQIIVVLFDFTRVQHTSCSNFVNRKSINMMVFHFSYFCSRWDHSGSFCFLTTNFPAHLLNIYFLPRKMSSFYQTLLHSDLRFTALTTIFASAVYQSFVCWKLSFLTHKGSSYWSYANETQCKISRSSWAAGVQ